MTGSIARCPLCGSVDCATVYDLTGIRSREDVPGLVMRCRGCPMWFKVLADGTALPTDYPGEHGEDQIAATYLLGESARALFQQTLARVEVRSRGACPRLLDIGAGQGALLEEALRMGYDAEGIDHSESNVRSASGRGLKVTPGAAEDLDREAAFDVITMMDFIEHVTDPMRILRRAHRALVPGGELVVYTPNHRGMVVVLAKLLNAVGVRYPLQEIFGRNHVCFFDDRSLPLALEQAGFAIRVQEQLAYDPSRPGQDISRLNLAAMMLVEHLGKPLHRMFRLLAYARKPD